MIAVKVVGASFTTTTTSTIPLYPTFDKRSSAKLCNLRVCRSKSDDSSSEASQPQGDPRRQELLARIAMLQAQKLRLTDYLDERSAYLTQFAEEATAEIDAIGENALKDLDEASARIMENIESRMQAFEESSEMNKQEIAKRDKELEDFKGEIEKGRNEGLFFQSLQEKPPVDKAEAKEETEKISNVTKDTAGSKTRRIIYLALIGLLAVGITDSFLSPDGPDWRKVAVLGAILIALLSQFIYEQNMLSESTENSDGNKSERGK